MKKEKLLFMERADKPKSRPPLQRVFFIIRFLVFFMQTESKLGFSVQIMDGFILIKIQAEVSTEIGEDSN